MQAHRHLRGDRVLYTDESQSADREWLKWQIDVAERQAGLRRGGRVHILRHTFCSRLASRNVPMLTIQALAGHQSIETTMRYMHLSAAAPREGTRALEHDTRTTPDESATSKLSGGRWLGGDPTGIRTHTPRVNQRGDGTRQIVTDALRRKRFPSVGSGLEWTPDGRVATSVGGKVSGKTTTGLGYLWVCGAPAARDAVTCVDTGRRSWTRGDGARPGEALRAPRS